MNWRLGPIIAMLVVGCSEQQASPQQTTPPPAPPTPAPATDAGGPDQFFDTDQSSLTPEELVGMWSEARNCGRPIVFNADGTFTDHTGATGQWTLRNDRLAMTKNGRTTENHANPFDADTFAVGDPGGLVVIYTRCRF